MKTPKRTPWQHTTQPCIKADGELRCIINEQHARWKRKNRIQKYKNTISMLRYRLKDTEDCLKLTQKHTKFFLVRPDHWHPMDENGNQLTRKQWQKKMNAEKRKEQQ